LHDHAGAEGRHLVTGRVRVDPAAILPPILIVDAADRSRSGIRISLPARPARRIRAVRERGPRYDVSSPPRLVRYGEGWLVAAGEDLSPRDVVRSLEYVVVDVETTGGSMGSDRITEVAAVRLGGDGRLLGEFATLVNPDRVIPPAITQLTRITQAMVSQAPRFHEIAPDVYRILEGAVFVAHNASFDWRFVSRELWRAGGESPRVRVLCTVRLARRVVPEISSRSLDALQFFFDVENEARHRAFGDARATARIFRKLLDRVDERDIVRWEDLERLLSRIAPRRKRRAMPMPVADA
jgi:DNA polymerase-3 subunit epsilon